MSTKRASQNRYRWAQWSAVIVLMVTVQSFLSYPSLGGDTPESKAVAKESKAVAETVPPRRDISAGMPTARKRIDHFIANVAGYNFEQCAEALHGATSYEDDGPIDLVGRVGQQGGGFKSSLRFLQVLADRRVAKLYVWLQAMPADEAARKSAALFEENLALHEEALKLEMAVARGEKKPFTDSSDEGQRHIEGCLGGNVQALSASLFLCAVFCQPDVVLKNQDDWYQTIGPLYEEMSSDPKLVPLLVRQPLYTMPEKLFLLNIYALLYDRHGCGPVERLVESVGKRDPRAYPRFDKVPFYAWDAHKNASDFIAKHGIVPADNSKILTHFWMARQWGALENKETRQDEVLAAARKLLEECVQGKKP